MTSRQKWLLRPVVTLVAIVVVFVVLFDWNWLKGLVEGQVSSRLGREFKIAGDLDVDLSLHPVITVNDLRLANPDWASDEPMLAVPRAQATVDLPALLGGELRLSEVSVTKPSLRLETRPDGPPNWQFPSTEPSGPPSIPYIGQLQIENASVDYLEHGSGRSIAADLAEVTGTTGGAGGKMALAANGQVEGEPLKLQVNGPPAAQLATAAEPYPMDLSLQLGESDLSGDLVLDLGEEVPGISATLHSDRVRTGDLAQALGAGAPRAPLDDALARARRALEEAQADAGGAQAQEDGGKRWFEFEQLPELHADIEYSIGQLEGPDLHLEDVDLHAGLKDGLPTLALSGNGAFKEEPVVLDVQAGPAGADQQQGTPYRIDAEIKAGETRITAQGGIDRPELLQGVHVDFKATSNDATELLRQLGVPAPPLPEVEAAGQLSRDGEVWELDDGYLQVGESAISGQVRVDLSGSRPFVTADLHSERLRMADFLPRDAAAAKAADAAKQAEEAAAEAVPLIKDGDINLEALPPIDLDLELQAGYIEVPEFRFDQLKLDLQLRDRTAVVDASGEGKFRDQPLGFELHAGTEDNLKNPDAPYPVDAALHSQKTNLEAKGKLARALSLTGLDVDVRLEGPDLAELGDILLLPLPGTPPYKLTGKVTHQADERRWNLIALNGTVGDSDLAGDVSLELNAERPTVVADLTSKQLDFDDLGVLVGAPTDTSAGETASAAQRQQAAEAKASDRILPAEEFDIPELRNIDARVKFEGESIQAKKLPLEGMSLSLTLEDGTIRFDPLRFTLADGEFEAIATLHGRSNVLDGEFDLTLRHIKLNQLFSRFNVDVADIEMEKEGAGTFGGQASLKVHGDSVATLAGSADGELSVIMDGGQINALIIEALGLDVGELLAVLMADEGEKKPVMVPVECFVGQFAVKDGVMDTEALVLKTADSTITGSGQIDLGEESLALELLAHPQDASAPTASTPVRIEGTFKDPKIDVVSEELKEKSLAALALGVVLPVVGAILPFIETGKKDQGLSCRALIQNAEKASGDVKDAAASDNKE
jgi:uncharacterized protein involved in outer membrane biogenesis